MPEHRQRSSPLRKANSDTGPPQHRCTYRRAVPRHLLLRLDRLPLLQPHHNNRPEPHPPPLLPRQFSSPPPSALSLLSTTPLSSLLHPSPNSSTPGLPHHFQWGVEEGPSAAKRRTALARKPRSGAKSQPGWGSRVVGSGSRPPRDDHLEPTTHSRPLRGRPPPLRRPGGTAPNALRWSVCLRHMRANPEREHTQDQHIPPPKPSAPEGSLAQAAAR